MEMNRNAGQSVLTFAYNSDGIRTSKKSGSVEHIYTLNGSQIVSEAFGSILLVYLYDESGAPIGMQYRTSSYEAGVFNTFYFEKNLQGDILAVYNESGVKVLSYTYDAWGNHTTTWHNSSGTNLYAYYNPFRYRGYYYDTETQLYYLQSRYYNPATGRFINADGYINANGDLIGYNMYAYCSNNPIMCMDPTGESITWEDVKVGFDVAFQILTAAPGSVLLMALHYNRNANNRADYTEEELIKKDIHAVPESDDKFHQNNQFNEERNRKYVIPNEKTGGWFSSEVVFFSDSTINNTPEDMGTFNVYSGDNMFLKVVVHGCFDVVPYMFWGNSYDDSTTIIDRFEVIFQ